MKFAINAPVLIQVVALRCANNVIEQGSLQGKVSPASEAIVKEVAFNCWPKLARAKDVTEFDAAKKTDVIFWVHLEMSSEKRPDSDHLA